MKRLTRTHVIAAGIIACLAAPAVIAQSEKVSIRMAPRPDQSTRVTMTQEMVIDMTVDGAAAVPGLTPMRMSMTSTMGMTQKTGAIKPDGTVDAELTYDQIRAEMTMNGQPMPAGDMNNPLVGKPVIVTYSRNGEMVDIKGLPATGLTDEAFKQMLGSFYGNLPAVALSVGETTTTPMDFGLPLPLPLPGAGPMKMTGETRTKLVSIDKDVRGRSARFDSAIDGKMVMELGSPDGKAKMVMNFSLGGTGTMVMDLDKGMLRSGLTTSTLVGKMDTPAGAAPAALPGMNMIATIKMTITSD